MPILTGKEAFDRVIQPVRIEPLAISNHCGSLSNRIRWREYGIEIPGGPATIEAEGDCGPANEEDLSPLSDGVEFSSEFAEKAADIIGSQRTMDHARLKAPAVMNTPRVRNDGGDS